MAIPYVRPEEFGAMGDGITDDGPAIQRAIDALDASSGGILSFDARHYRMATGVVIDNLAISIRGQGFTEGPDACDGTWILLDADRPGADPRTFSAFTFKGAAARGSSFRDIALRQSHPGLAAHWAPTPYDYAFKIIDCLGSIDFSNIFLCSINKGIHCSNSGRLNIERVRGQVFTTGIEIDYCYDIPRIEYAHFWPFGSSDARVLAYQQDRLDCIVLRRCDGIYLGDIFALAARSVIRLSASTDRVIQTPGGGTTTIAGGSTTKLYAANIYGDFAQHTLLIDGDGCSAQISNITTQGESCRPGAPAGSSLAGATGIRIAGKGARVQIASLRCDQSERHAVQIEGQDNRLAIGSFHARGYNRLKEGAAAIHCDPAGSNAVSVQNVLELAQGHGGPLFDTASGCAQPLSEAALDQIDLPRLIPELVRANQQLLARVDALEARLASPAATGTG